MATDYTRFGFLKVALTAPPVAVADPRANRAAILDAYGQAPADAALVVAPELSVTGYTCEDLFFGADLRRATEQALGEIAAAAGERVLVVGAPWWLDDGRVLNCAFVCAGGNILGAVPKIAQPNHGEFYEKRWFASGRGCALAIDSEIGAFPLRADTVFGLGATRFAIEICEDLWAPSPPSGSLALGGAEVLLNLSASTELVAKADYRRELVRTQSARTISAYLYAGAGPTESTKDAVFGGHLLAAENGLLLAESPRFALAGASLAVEVDCGLLRRDRARNNTFATAPRPAPLVVRIEPGRPPALPRLRRRFARQPFVPQDEAELDTRAAEILSIQATGLARRALAADARQLVIGISGGLDSTLAYLVCLDALRLLDLPPTALRALTMPGPGTSEHTIESARRLAAATGVTLREVPIHDAVREHLRAIGHGGEADVTFENAQARERTQILFDTGNRFDGIVVGTGDLSELALGWCTFNADHMAGYNVNAGVPKTLVAHLVRWYAARRADAGLRAVLTRVVDTPISPELRPSAGAGVGHRTEAIIGPYELHDFFLFHFLRGGAGAAKILEIATATFHGTYSRQTIKRWLAVFFERFHAAQFKRTTLPPGPKVGTVSLSPRGDWRMPDEATAKLQLAALEQADDDASAAPMRLAG